MPFVPKSRARVLALSTEPEADTEASTVPRVTRVVSGAGPSPEESPPTDAQAAAIPPSSSTTRTPLTINVLRFVDSFTTSNHGKPRFGQPRPMLRVC